MKNCKRFLAIILSVVMVLGCTSASWFAVSGDGTGVTEGQLIAQNYEFLNAHEKDILNCDAIGGGRYTYSVLSSEEGSKLIHINSADKTVKVDDFSDGNNVFKPVKVTVNYKDENNNERSKEITLTNGEGVIDCQSDKYTIDAVYEAAIFIGVLEQMEYINTPAALANGIIDFNSLVDCNSSIGVIADNMDQLYKLVDGSLEREWIDSDGDKQVSSIKLDDSTKESAAIKALYESRNANGGKFEVSKYIEGYMAASNKTAYALENGSATKESLGFLTENLGYIVSDTSSINSVISMAQTFGFKTEAKQLSDAMSVLKSNYIIYADINSRPWAICNLTTVKDSATVAEMAALDIAVTASVTNGIVTDVTEHNGESLDSRLVLASATYTAGINQYKLTATVKANVVPVSSENSADTTAIAETSSVTLAVDEGTSDDDIIAKIKESGVISDALSVFDQIYPEYEINENNYDIIYKQISKSNWSVSFEPKKIELEINYDANETVTVPYGYRLRLEKHSDITKSYDYTVNGQNYQEGSLIVIKSATAVSRKTGKAVEEKRVTAVIAASKTYSSEYTQQEKDILNSQALKSDSLWYRAPDSSLVSVKVSLVSVKVSTDADSFDVTAQSFGSGLVSGAAWNAVKGYVVDENGNSLHSFDISEGKGSFTYSGEFDHVNVEYILKLGNKDVSDDTLGGYVNIADTLAKEGAAQIAELNALINNKDLMNGLKEVYKSRIELLQTISSDYKQESKDAIKFIAANCINTANTADNGPLYLYEYLTAYADKAASGNGLAYYYTGSNASKIAFQIKHLTQALNTLWEDPEFQEDLKNPDIAKYQQRINDVRIQLSGVEITPVNEYIDTNSNYIPALASAVINANSKTSVHAVKPLEASVLVSASTDDKANVKVTVEVRNSKGNVIASDTASRSFVIGSVVSDANAALLESLISDMESTFGVDKAHYECTLSGTSVKAGDTVTGDCEAIYSWSPVKYTVKIEGEDDQYIYADGNLSVVLPGSETASENYIYRIGNTEIEVSGDDKSYDFGSLASMDALFDSQRVLVITRETINVNHKKTIDLVNQLNKAIAKAGLTFDYAGKKCLIASFIALEGENGDMAIVLRVAPNRTNTSVNNVLTSVATVLIDTYFDEIYVGGEIFWNKEVHLQAVVDMILNSGLGFDYYVNQLIDANGQIREITDDEPGLSAMQAVGAVNDYINVAGNTYINNTDILGGKIADSTIKFGKGNEEINARFLVTIEDFDLSASNLNKVRNGILKINKYINASAENGKINATLNIPEKIYPYLFTAASVLGYTDFSDTSDVDLEKIMDFVLKNVDTILSDPDFSASTIENTLSMLGREKKLPSNTNKIIKLAAKLLKNYELRNVSQNGSVYSAILNYNINSLMIEDLKLSDTVTKLIYEAKGADPAGINVPFEIDLKNTDTKYDALVIDAKAAGLKKHVYTKDLAKDIASFGNNAVIVLLSDVTLSKDLVVNNTVFLDLNGFNITGNIVSNGKLNIVDSRMSTYDCGTVFGSVSGNVTATGGRFIADNGVFDVSSMLKDGYRQNAAGYVTSTSYTIKETADGDIIVSLSGDILNTDNVPNVKAAVLDVVADLAMNYYTTAKLKVNGNDIYAITLNDLLKIYKDRNFSQVANELLSKIDTQGISALVETIYNDLTDFNAVKTAIENGQNIASYSVERNYWDVTTGVSDDDHLLVNIGYTQDSKVNKLVFVLDEEATAEQTNKLARLAENLALVVKQNDFSFNLSNLSYAKRSIGYDLSITEDLTLDFTINRNYAAAIALATAYETNNSELIAALNTYLEYGTQSELKTAFENTSIADIVKGIRNLSKYDVEFMASELSINGDITPIKNLTSTYGDLLNIISAVLGKFNYKGNSNKLSYYAADGEYGAYIAEADKRIGSVKIKLVLFSDKSKVTVVNKDNATVKEFDDICDAIEYAQSGYTVIINETVSFTRDVTVSADISIKNLALAEFNGKRIKLVGTAASVSSDKKIEIANIISGSAMYEITETVGDGIYTYTLDALIPTIDDPVVTHGGSIAGSKVDTENKYIYIDVDPSGINWNTFGDNVTFATTNANNAELIPTHNGTSESLVCTGDVVTAVATNVAGGRAETTYTVIVVGDTNCNGKIDSGDAVAMMNHFMEEIELEALPLLAADANNNGKVDSGDAVCNSNKFMLWGTEYVSHYKKSESDDQT